MKRLAKILAWLIGLPLLLVIIAVCGIAWLVGTDKGFDIATNEAGKRVPGLDLGKIAGNLTRGVDSDRILFENDAFQITVSGLDSDWRGGCLLQREFCLDNLSIEDIHIIQKQSGDSTESSTGPIELPAIALPIDVTVNDLSVDRFRFTPVEGPSHTASNIHLSADARGSVIRIHELSAAYESYTADINGQLTLDGDYPIDLSLDLVATDVVDSHDAHIALALDDTVRNLNFSAQVGGAASASVAGTVQPLEASLPLSATINSNALGWPLDTMAIASVRDLAVSVDGTLDDYELELSADAAGEELPETGISVAGRVNAERALIPNLRLTTLGGDIEATVSVDWTDGIAWLAAIGFDNIEPGHQVEGLEGAVGGTIDLAGTVAEDDWTLNLNSADITGEINTYPFRVSARANKTSPDTLVIEELILDNGENQIRGAGALALADTAVSDLSLSAVLPQLENLVPELNGNVSADINIAGQLTAPDISLDISTDRLSYQDYQVRGVRVTADVDDAAIADSVLSVTVREIVAAEQTIQNFKLNATGTRADHQLSFFVDGPEATAVDLALTGSLADNFDWRGELRSAVLDVPAHTIRLDAATALEWNQQDALFGVEAHCWQTEESRLCLENKVHAAPQGTAIVSLDTYPLARLNPFLPAESTMRGELGANTTVQWGPDIAGGFSATLQARLNDGGFSVQDSYDEPVSFSYDTVTLDTTVDPLEVRAQLNIASNTLGAANANIVLDAQDENKPIAGQITLEGFDIAVAKAFLPDFDEFGGTLSAAGQLSGQLTDPRFNGNVQLSDPLIRGELLPLDINGGQITARVAGQRADIDGDISAGEGDIQLEGSARWSNDDWRAEVNVAGNRLNIATEPVIESDVYTNIDVTARPNNIRIEGRIDIPSAFIDVAELPDSAETLSEDIVVIEDIDTEEEEVLEQVAAGETNLRVDVDVVLGDDVELDAYGLQANLTGDIGVSLRSPDPVSLSGEIEVVDGIFKQYGQNLQASGRILFVGPVAATRLDIEAIRDIEQENRIAGLLIEGQVDKPAVSLFTEPSDKGEDSILSYIILGRDINETSDQETNLLATAALAIGVKGGEFVGGNIADSLGIDDFAFETRGNGDDTELVVSGRLNDRLLVKYGRSVFQTESTLYLRYDLTRKLYLEAAAGVERAVDLFYEFSF